MEMNADGTFLRYRACLIAGGTNICPRSLRLDDPGPDRPRQQIQPTTAHGQRLLCVSDRTAQTDDQTAPAAVLPESKGESMEASAKPLWFAPKSDVNRSVFILDLLR